MSMKTSFVGASTVLAFISMGSLIYLSPRHGYDITLIEPLITFLTSHRVSDLRKLARAFTLVGHEDTALLLRIAVAYLYYLRVVEAASHDAAYKYHDS